MLCPEATLLGTLDITALAVHFRLKLARGILPFEFPPGLNPHCALQICTARETGSDLFGFVFCLLIHNEYRKGPRTVFGNSLESLLLG